MLKLGAKVTVVANVTAEQYGEYTYNRYQSVIGMDGKVVGEAKEHKYWVEVPGWEYPLFVFTENELS